MWLLIFCREIRWKIFDVEDVGVYCLVFFPIGFVVATLSSVCLPMGSILYSLIILEAASSKILTKGK